MVKQRASQVALVVKNPPANAGDTGEDGASRQGRGMGTWPSMSELGVGVSHQKEKVTGYHASKGLS